MDDTDITEKFDDTAAETEDDLRIGRFKTCKGKKYACGEIDMDPGRKLDMAYRCGLDTKGDATVRIFSYGPARKR
ncbi:hypothetical protein KY362_06930 [Candidatus Woesearchaeota archaeon]|nr:hypothetical protein [Candidatus Woesearchaeota archaeon]